jgi:hypothetical protein
MIPHEKEMVERLKDQPFALIGINSDGGRDAVQKILQEQGITWRNVLDGTTSGPIATRWNVHGWPTIYILDKQGRIRFRDLRDEAMEEAVLSLLAENP